MTFSRELADAYIKQTQKYFNKELMDDLCGICEHVPSYTKDWDNAEEMDVTCRDCPLYVEGDFISCISHETYVAQEGRKHASEERLRERGNYLIKKGEEAGIDMSGVKK